VGQPLGDFDFSGGASLRCLQGCDAHGYDTESNLVSITDASAHSTFFTYDAFGRVTNTNSPSTLSETYAGVYPERTRGNADNNLTSKTDRKGQTIQYVYDALNSGFRSPMDSTASPEIGPADAEELSGRDQRAVCVRPGGQGPVGEQSHGQLRVRLRQHGAVGGDDDAVCVPDRDDIQQLLQLRCGIELRFRESRGLHRESSERTARAGG